MDNRFKLEGKVNDMLQLSSEKKRLLLLMILLLSVSQACTDIYVAALPQMTREFHTTLAKTNLTITVYTYAQAFFFLFIGVISDIFGRRPVLICCILVQICASFLIALSDSLWLMIIFRVFQALGSGAIYIVLRLIIKDVMEREEQIYAVGMLLIAMVVSPALAPVIGAWIIHFLSWRACFDGLGMALAILLLWFFLTVKESNSNLAKIRSNFSIIRHVLNYVEVFTDRVYFSLMLVVGGTFASYFGFIALSSYMYIDEFKVSPLWYSYSYFGLALAFLLGNRIMLWLNNAGISAWSLIQKGVILSWCGLVIMGVGLFLPHYGVLVLVSLGLFMVRLATALINPPVQVLVTLHFDEKGAHALGLLSCMQYVFAGMGAALVAALPYHPSLSLVMSSIFFTLVSALGYWAAPNIRKISQAT